MWACVVRPPDDRPAVEFGLTSPFPKRDRIGGRSRAGWRSPIRLRTSTSPRNADGRGSRRAQSWASFAVFLWDALQGGIIEYATYNVSLQATLVDSTYHTAEGVLCGVILGFFYRPANAKPELVN
jgi:hypothetical protein